MSRIPSPYCVETPSGTLELTKGTYLALMRRKSSATNTLVKSKPISRSFARQSGKMTLKKSYTHNVVSEASNFKLRRSVAVEEMVLRDQIHNKHVFEVADDRDIFKNRFPIPSISLEYDYDNESQWADIEATAREMTSGLFVAAYDRKYGC